LFSEPGIALSKAAGDLAVCAVRCWAIAAASSQARQAP
jgi:hypothetical protein